MSPTSPYIRYSGHTASTATNTWVETSGWSDIGVRLEAAIQDNTKWITHAGKIMSISDMADEHLINAINMIQAGSDAQGRPVHERAARKLDSLLAEAGRRKLKGFNDGWDA